MRDVTREREPRRQCWEFDWCRCHSLSLQVNFSNVFLRMSVGSERHRQWHWKRGVIRAHFRKHDFREALNVRSGILPASRSSAGGSSSSRHWAERLNSNNARKTQILDSVSTDRRRSARCAERIRQYDFFLRSHDIANLGCKFISHVEHAIIQRPTRIRSATGIAYSEPRPPRDYCVSATCRKSTH